MDFKQGDILKLNEEGLDAFTHGKKKALERWTPRRFYFVGMDDILIDKWGEKTLAVRQLDIEDSIENAKLEHWTRAYLQKAQ